MPAVLQLLASAFRRGTVAVREAGLRWDARVISSWDLGGDLKDAKALLDELYVKAESCSDRQLSPRV